MKDACWRMGEGAVFGRDGFISLGEGALFEVGKDVRLGRGWTVSMVDAPAEASVLIGDGCRLMDDVRIATFGGARIDIGASVFIGWGTVLAAHRHVVIGAGSAIAEYVSIRDHNHLSGADAVHASSMQVAPVTIGERVWIGAKATIVAGVAIGDDAVIGANAVVTRDVPSGMRVGGVPARPIGGRKDDD